MADSASWTIVDYDGQKGSFAINTVPLSGANLAAQEALLDTLRGTFDDIIDGVVQAQHINITDRYLPSTTKATDPEAQRGNKWRVDAYDNTQLLGAGIPNPSYLKTFQYDLPTANLELRVENENDVWVEGSATNVAEFDPFVAAFEAVAKSPNAGSLQVTQVVAVTRAAG